MSISLNGFAEESITLKMAGTAAKGTPVSISASLTAAPSQADGVFAGLLTASPKGGYAGVQVNGGVKAASSGPLRLVLELDTTKKTVGFCL
mgnify:CR=1 FL=1